ncbi:MAG TPA: TonB-dependent receptor, partial [Xanthomonadales bacterium]|nr:TonB-dependent receptor [Xanthomonadales bacterium]
RTRTETDRIKRVEVLYGPASVLYGSDALGGVIAITTWDPSDLLATASRDYSLGLRTAYRGADQSWMVSAIGALGKDEHGLLLAGTRRDGHQAENQAPFGTPEDPQNWHSEDFMLRYTFDTAGGSVLRLSAMGQQSRVETEMKSLLGYGRRFRTTTALNGEDQNTSQQYDLTWESALGPWDQVTAQAYTANYSTEQLTLETRGEAMPPLALRREFNYDQDHTGINYSMFRQVNWGGSSHRIGLGLQWLQTESSEYRDGLQTNLETGSSSNVILGETMPVRDFPNSRSRELGVFVQDEISLAGSRWQFIPALRWDDYSLDPKPDELWLEDFPEMEVASVKDNEFTPRIGVLYQAGDYWSLYGQYARGFRAPPFEDANIGLDLPLFGYRAIPNPDLKSETSNGIELGVRRLGPGSRFSLAAFDTDYDDFIESRALIGIDEVSGDLLFQSRNIDKAAIFGLDMRFDQDLANWTPSLEGWLFNFAAYWARGENRESDEPLNSIAPPQAILGFSWSSPDDRWNFGFITTLTAAKNRDDIDETGGPRFATPSWVTFDLTAGWHATGWLEIRAAVFNLGNRTYWRWLDVARLEASDPMIPLLSRPGRNYSVSARINF